MYMRISWGGQLAAGVLLFAISFVIESKVLGAYLDKPLLAMSLAGALELSKAVSIVLYRFIKSHRGDESYPLSVAGTTLVFRMALLSLSVLCSVMYLSDQLDRPNLETVRQQDLTRIDQEYRETVAAADRRLEQARAAAAATVRERYLRLSQETRDGLRPTIEHLEHSLRKEMDNSIKGVFKGPRYRELERRLEREKEALALGLASLASQEQAAADGMNRERTTAHAAALKEARRARDESRQRLLASSYQGDERVENPMLHSFLQVANAVLDTHLDNLVFVFAFSVFIALLMELGILVSFEVLTLSHLPVFDAEHRVNIHLQRKRAENQGDLDAFRMDDELHRGKTGARVDDLIRRMAPEPDRAAA